jgi:hypothetical protein
LADTEACVEALADDRLRAEFSVKLRLFLDMLDVVLPRPEGLPYVRDAKQLAFIYARSRNRYRDTPVLGKDVGPDVGALDGSDDGNALGTDDGKALGDPLGSTEGNTVGTLVGVAV